MGGDDRGCGRGLANEPDAFVRGGRFEDLAGGPDDLGEIDGRSALAVETLVGAGDLAGKTDDAEDVGAGVGDGLLDPGEVGAGFLQKIDLVLDVRDRRRDVVKDAPRHHLHLVRERGDAAHEPPDDPDAEREEYPLGGDGREGDEDVALQCGVDFVGADGLLQQVDAGQSRDRGGDDHGDSQEGDRRPVDAL